MSKFHLVPSGPDILLTGTDDNDKPFHVSLDRVWAMNLVLELEDWLSVNGEHPTLTERELHRVDL